MYETFNKNERLRYLNLQLSAWKGKLSTHERGDVAKALDIHPRVLDNYIRGAGKAVTTCEAILAHLTMHYPDRKATSAEA